ncbi:hypothetical protein [Atopomonas sediminilitoris]|uniref:hypothetical protein n=1 Tax=Atopomonas sediminilitoris TaxID=2919919 RepID=UPI001F4D7A9E|nr:hypothetical protein [Atopomonas sediminilitoris]MCJ8170777.1 hypothetical protein [Atopomonas sediminilitoris]
MSPTKNTNLVSYFEFADWTNIYTEAHIAELIQVPLAEFLQNPSFYLIQAGQETAVACVMNGYKPLLPKQVLAAAKIHAQWNSEG